jgi:hypothetical protein
LAPTSRCRDGKLVRRCGGRDGPSFIRRLHLRGSDRHHVSRFVIRHS